MSDVTNGWSPDPAGVYFSDYFGVSPEDMETYGAFDISVLTDLPVFIDPFLAFNSPRQDYQALHEHIIEYLRYLKKQAATGLSDADIKNLYSFKEVKQNWLGFTIDGNRGKGLGPKFARALHAALGDILGNFGSETLTASSHLEKVALVQDKVGRDNISDFTTNLIKFFLLRFTEDFAAKNLNPGQTKKVAVQRALFDYNTETWATRTYTLPWIPPRVGADGRPLPGDYVILTPVDLLTRDDTWINQTDMVSRFDALPPALPDDQTRAQVDRYLKGRLSKEPSNQQIRSARLATLRAFPELVDYYIAMKEDDRELAAPQSFAKTKDVQELLRDQVQRAALDIASKTSLFTQPLSSYDEALLLVDTFKTYVEDQDGYTLISRGKGVGFSSEKEVQTFFGLLLQRTRFDYNREPNNGRGPVDFKLSMGAFDKTLIEFKLAKSTALERNLLNQVEVYEKANNTTQSVKVVIVYTEADATKVAKVFKDIDTAKGFTPGTTSTQVVVIDARSDNKPSASNVRSAD